MTPEDLEKYRALLHALRDAMEKTGEAVKESAKPVALDQARFGRLSRMEEMQAQAIAVSLSRRRDVQQTRIQNALERIGKGEYGVCLACNATIESKRLDFDPTAFLCPPCAQRAEAGRKPAP